MINVVAIEAVVVEVRQHWREDSFLFMRLRAGTHNAGNLAITSVLPILSQVKASHLLAYCSHLTNTVRSVKLGLTLLASMMEVWIKEFEVWFRTDGESAPGCICFILGGTL